MFEGKFFKDSIHSIFGMIEPLELIRIDLFVFSWLDSLFGAFILIYFMNIKLHGF